ncbi:MAG: polyprenyl synthetase family protein [Actinomycetota bacterium]|nr:polyprenyl synthetase family protein [Actinomycetota bacterium]
MAAGSPVEHADLRARVTKAVDALLARQRPRLDAISTELAPMADALSDFLLDSGKRLRPAFAYWGWRGAGGADGDEVVAAVACLEWLQACALIHDDVMDGSDTRRGAPALHRRFSSLHRTEGWRGDPEAFGQSAAILLGDLCLIWADEMYNTAGMDFDALRRGQPVYDEMRTELMAGQYLDLLEQAIGGSSTERAMRVARYKSAKYTVERPLHLGAALAGAPSSLVDAYSDYGLPLGEAFQLRDDVLGVFGDPSCTGKPAGDDLREGKRTVLIALTLEQANPRQAALVRRHLGDPHLSPAGLALLREAISDTGALARTEAMIGARTESALSALAGADLDPQARAVLGELALAATARRV